MQITKGIVSQHFWLSEFDCKDGTPYPKEWIRERLKPLCEQLEIIRDYFGSNPINIESGFRTPSYNRKVGGVPNSQHLYGRAADIKIRGIPARQVAQAIRQMIQDKKLILKGLGSYASFTHVDIRPTEKLVYWIK